MTLESSPAKPPVPERERCNRAGSETRQRTEIVAVRCTPDEKAAYAALAERKHLSLPDLMRMAVEAALIEEAIRGRA